MRKALIACAVTALLVGAGTAGASRLITGKDIRNGSVAAADLARSAKKALKGKRGARGPQGPKGDPGPAGPKGDTGAHGRPGRDGKDGREGKAGKPGPVLPTVGHLLYVANGAEEIAHVSFVLDRPVALRDLGNLTFFQERVYGDGAFGANVILGVDADRDGRYEADDLGYHVAARLDPRVLNGDTFVEMDALGPTTVKVDPLAVEQWYTPSAAGDAYATGPGCEYDQTVLELAANCASDRLTPDRKVHVVRYVVGGSSSWNDDAIRVTAPRLVGATVTAGVVR